MQKNDDLIARARMAREAGRTADAVDFMRKVAAHGMLSQSEGELYAAAFKVAVKELLTACHLIDRFSDQKPHRAVAEEYIGKLQGEIRSLCRECRGVADVHAERETPSGEETVFWHRVSGDCSRLLAEVSVAFNRDAAASQAEVSYTAAGLAAASLSPAHPGRLATALNFSLFQAEILEDVARACFIAKGALDDAVGVDGLWGGWEYSLPD
mmetsp:Transcript_42695/g.112547  ORF Transcript_42695/g.112547 Transcript_42695/m.112547 type:complete len:211 (-) Transcript_42695:225-857(-)